MSQTSAVVPNASNSRRRPGRLIHRNNPTLLAEGDYMAFQSSYVSFLRGAESLRMNLANGLIDNKCDLSMVPNSAFVTSLVNFIAPRLGLESRSVVRTEDKHNVIHTVFRFKAAQTRLQLIHDDAPTVLLAGDLMSIKGSYISLHREGKIILMERMDGEFTQSHDLSMVPNGITKERLAQLFAVVFELEVKCIDRTTDVLTFEFS